ncbi:MAG: tRNA 2-thiouridine(34) synthase MnmA [Patescibacteria group bacterium]
MMNKKGERNKRVFVGMSGGVDSSVSAALLKQAGYSVTGVFIKVWEPEGFKCTWREDRREAMRVAAVLDIPLVTIDLSEEYEKQVVKYMIREYKAGRTPNPDIECNRSVKFGAFYDWAIKNGADFVATGHYAQVVRNKNIFSLAMGRDKNKDQSYFLWTLKPEQLEKCLFPVGNYQKTEVRKLAKKFKLPNFAKKDSQGLCFIGKLDVKKFLQKYIKTKTGKVVKIVAGKEKVVGQHDGVWFYTIGERHHGYIVRKDLKRNILIVSDQPPVLENNIINLVDTNWLARPETGEIYQARIRHRGELLDCKINKNKVTFLVSPGALASGQSLVLYAGERCLGGGVVL